MALSIHHDEPEDTNEEASARINSAAHAMAHKRRIAALRAVAGIWADRPDLPADGLQYERELRDEWR
jgi:hypothetical protein